jgi:gluconate 2-dehydrogenase gamma chain
MFFDARQRATVEAAMARIIPTDDTPGAREAGTIDFLDRYLSGFDHIYAKPDGSGFETLQGRRAQAWQQRIETSCATRTSTGSSNWTASVEIDLDFFPLLALHTRQGFYADPVYGGNRNRIGRDVIGFPGPTSFAEVHSGRYSVLAYFASSEWSPDATTCGPTQREQLPVLRA